MQIERFKVSGMTCGGCTGKVTKALKSVAGVGDVNVSLADGEVIVQFEEQKTSLALLKSVVAETGYGVIPAGVADGPARRGCCG